LIEIQEISKKFSGQVVLDKFSLTIDYSDKIALIGPNGAGKTTLIRIILGHYQHNGSISVFGENPRKNRIHVLDHIGFVPQYPPPIAMNIKELVQFSAKISKRSKVEKIYQIADDLKLDIYSNEKKPFVKLSGGMKQKLLIALALAKDPSLLIMDEPTANLDLEGREAFFLKLKNIPKETIIILSSHRSDELLSLVNRIIEMNCGKIVVNE